MIDDIPKNSDLLILVPLFAAMALGFMYWYRRQVAPQQQALRALAEAEGWTGILPPSLATSGGVHGSWNGRRASLEYGLQRNAPPMIVARVEGRGPRLAITPREPGADDILSKPVVVTGPPLVELPAVPDLWIRCDDADTARALLLDSNAAGAIRRSLAEGVSEINADGTTITIVRRLPRGPKDDSAIVEAARQTWRTAVAIAAHYGHQPAR